MGLLWMSINGSKRSDEYDECQKMAMLNIRLNFSIHFKKKGYNLKDDDDDELEFNDASTLLGH